MSTSFILLIKIEISRAQNHTWEHYLVHSGGVGAKTAAPFRPPDTVEPVNLSSCLPRFAHTLLYF